MTLFLNGTWKVTHRPYQADIQDILAENFVPEGWLNANVPEEIHAAPRGRDPRQHLRQAGGRRTLERGKGLDLLQKVLCSRHGKNRKRHPAL